MYKKWEISDATAAEYLRSLVGKTYKLLPIWEQHRDFFFTNHTRLMEEILQVDKSTLHSASFVSYVFKVGSLLDLVNDEKIEAEDKQKRLKIHIRECIDLINRCAEGFGKAKE